MRTMEILSAIAVAIDKVKVLARLSQSCLLPISVLAVDIQTCMLSIFSVVVFITFNPSFRKVWWAFIENLTRFQTKLCNFPTLFQT